VWPETFVFVVMTRNNPRVYEHVVPLPHAKADVLTKMLIEYELQVEAGIFPLNTSSNLCSVDYCPFWDSCPASLLEAAA
jgi:hypothetical protein